jgi:hypothetical protein
MTEDNQEFVKQVVLDEFGPPSIPESSGMPYVSPLKEVVRPRGEWQPRSVRTGLIARKIGIYPMWDKEGKRFLATLLQVWKDTNTAWKLYIMISICHWLYGVRLWTIMLSSISHRKSVRETMGLSSSIWEF